MLETNPTHPRSPLTWPAHYTICVLGHVDPRWSEWLDGLAITHLENGQSSIHGDIVDRAALQGILTKIANLNLEILSVSRDDQLEEKEI